jgi:glycosyltransferase involved in cell wall biosynthesis
MRERLLVARPTMGVGGADRMTLSLLRHLPRDRFDMHLALLRREGPWMADVPADIAVHELRAGSLWTAIEPLRRLIARTRPDVIFSTSSGMNVPMTMAWLAQGSPGRLVLSERAALFQGGKTPKRLLLAALKRALYPSADAVAVVSEGIADEVERELGIPRSMITVTFNPVVDQEILAAAEEPVDHPFFREEVPVLVAAGRLLPVKGFDVLLRAFGRVVERIDARLIILGEGPQRRALEDQMRGLGIEGKVSLPGFDRNPFRFMARAAAFVLSSRNEGLPGVLIQAMACGAPVISTDCHFGPAEVIGASGDNGILVPVDDELALSAAVTHVLSDMGLRSRLGAAARARAQHFSVEASLSRYAQAISPSVNVSSDAPVGSGTC